MVTRDVRFSFDTLEQKAEFEAYARAHGMSLSAYAKWACFAQRNRNRSGSHHQPRKAGRATAPHPTGQSTIEDNGRQDAT